MQADAMPLEVEELYSNHKDGQTSPSLDEYSKVLIRLSNHFQKSFFIVDALDEHLNKQEVDYASKIEFLSQLKELQLQSKPTTCCRLFLTSRETLSIQDPPTTRIDILAKDSDVESYVKSRILDPTKFIFAEKLQTKEALVKLITERLVQSAQGVLVIL
jgi:hypothetical protein